MKNLIILTIVVVVLVGVVVFLYTRDSEEIPVLSPTLTLTPTPTVEGTPIPLPTVSGSKATVTYSDSGYSPAEVKIKKGDTVVFDNKSSKMMWTASAVHPTHKAYPGTDTAKCGTSSQNGMFDACKDYGPGELWEFKFNEQGVWKYHNHLQPTHTGTIVVE